MQLDKCFLQLAFNYLPGQMEFALDFYLAGQMEFALYFYLAAQMEFALYFYLAAQMEFALYFYLDSAMASFEKLDMATTSFFTRLR